jgi:hypothetical protein
MKKALVTGVLAMIFLAVGVAAWRIIRLNGDSWRTSHRLSEALVGAREVTLIEHVRGKIIAQKMATPDEMARLQNATSRWLRPFKPETNLCFYPHHRIEIRRANGPIETVEICFLCQGFTFVDNEEFNTVALPPSLDESLEAFFTSVGMRPRTWDEYTAIEQSIAYVERQAPP